MNFKESAVVVRGKPLFTLHYFLRNGISEVVLATALEKHGALIADTYGRLRVANAAEISYWLEYLEEHYCCKCDPISREEESDRIEDGDDLLAWDPNHYPDFEGIAKLVSNQSVPSPQGDACYDSKEQARKSLDPRSERAYLNTIAALLEFISGKFPLVDKHPAFTTETELIEIIDEKYKGIYGLSASNLSRKFCRAKESLAKT